MRRLVVIPEDVYLGLMSNANSGDPFDKQIVEKSRKIGQILSNKRIPNDKRQLLYNQEVKKLKNLKAIKPEAVIERQNAEIPLQINRIDDEESRGSIGTNITQISIETAREEIIPAQQEIPVQVPENVPSPPQEVVAPQDETPARKPKNVESINEKVDRITQSLLARQHELPINEQGNIRREDGTFVTGSHLDRIVLYSLDKSAYGNKPNGYNDFIREAQKHPDLVRILNINSQDGKSIFKFRPLLWKRF